MRKSKNGARHWSQLNEQEREEMVAKARAFIDGMPLESIVWDRVTKHCGLSHQNGIRLVLDPGFRARRSEQTRKARQRHASIIQAGGFSAKKMSIGDGPSTRIPPDVIAARLAEIPPDTRTLTGYLFGDPLPARSALARRPA